ncbi:hypothetical protein [Amycolatopsis sp. WQ 127309]|uniref:hypothetical protein n=1 Tax=Amycolatopsis sp. WQ 127309 TaxID=2932773 RepID=UPI001FF3185E|nr:hypothetical protein [Amycolatopsis sp. WQ 127309]UOZ03225.1 hypothetical protein MUY22_30740 [Amycolatopsis sp. WQ 127309]
MSERRARRVDVAAQPRHVSLDPDPDAEFEYTGIVLRRELDGAPAEETWLPVGDEPSEEDDERLIAALHDAWLWTTESERDPVTMPE